MIFVPLIIGKIVSRVSRILKIGSGETWSGEIALRMQPNILQELFPQLHKGIIFIAGTNGKTTTALMIKKILEENGERIVHNVSGANLVNGVVSSFITHASWTGTINADYGVFEVDENSLPEVVKSLKSVKSKIILVLLNLFRDQLDRYGEVDVIADKWEKALSTFDTGNQYIKRSHNFVLDTGNQANKPYQIIANADDPLIAALSLRSRPGLEAGAIFFGLNEPGLYQKKMEHATDSIFCLNCGARLTYEGTYYSHIGIWKCLKCGAKRTKPDISEWKYPLPGLYNRYNTLAAVATAQVLGISNQNIQQAFENFSPAFGRQEEFQIDGKKAKLLLSKNPAGFNESLRTALALGARNFLFVVNDRIPDGRDVSWIWDVDFEMLKQDERAKKEHDAHNITISGDRCYDMGLRIKYVLHSRKLKVSSAKPTAGKGQNIAVEQNLFRAIQTGLNQVDQDDSLYILATYSAMLDVRKIFIGRKIL